MTVTSPSRHAANRALRTPGARYRARIETTSAATLQSRLIASEVSNLTEAFDRLAADGSVCRAAALTVKARRRFVIGSGKSHAYATLLAADLSTAVAQVNLVDDSSTSLLDLLSDVRESDVLVAFSFRRYRRSTVAAAREFTAAGGTVVAVTDDEAAPLAEHARELVVVATDSASYADSPTAVAATSHVLATLTTASAKGARRRFADRDRISEDLGLYLDDAGPSPVQDQS
ncbi:DNA-binding transcriptional regulator, MurR/RpiR family, contains HTH and SIS domains [Propionibacterium cyclohexanicum]|uniref:DNA-binding transcriptional regulator, MurR/RpiR family, contains HTH and SIS domains n=1 Tax=Propionibacterium cyclohexanicum TaxID=64702 RepID=A0A1H9TDK7_9ACTN|nr:SIS domain-containing protein [Propionibacterium cyclohexanicum]SER95044.1 DNA-binding transcriptional regulator, MurR/RpiR family, contains HTH and SIS domains [Propionibacterium cyclohexanicum]